VVFNEDVVGFDQESDVQITKTGTVAHSGFAITGGPRDYVVTLSEVRGDGTISFDGVVTSGITDLATNKLDASIEGGTVTVDNTAPIATVTLAGETPTGADSLLFSLRFSENVGATFDSSKLLLTTGSLAGTISLLGTDPVYAVTVKLADESEDGTIAISLASGVTDAAGNSCASVTSEPYNIFNWNGFTAEPQDQDLYEGGSYTFRVEAGCNSPSMSYQWKWEDGSKTLHEIGGDSSIYTLSNVSKASEGEYWCVVTYDEQEHVTQKAVLNVESHMEFTAQLQGGQVTKGGVYRFDVASNGGFAPLTYEWKKDEITIPGATSSTYEISPAALEDAGSYTVEVSDAYGETITSNSVVLTVAQGVPVTTATGAGLLIALLALSGCSLSRKE
jgi:hypothetical protein